jgi:hypothetical protein
VATVIEYSKDDIIQIAEAQRSLGRAVWGILAIWVSFFFVGLLQLQLLLLILIPVVMCLAGFNTFTLEKAMKSSAASAALGALLAALLSLGCIGLVVMWMVSSRAGKVLKARGLNGGFMGVSREDLDKWKAGIQPIASRQEIFRCPNPKCCKPVFSDHQYVWCTWCGDYFSTELCSTIPSQQKRVDASHVDDRTNMT